jgi:competence protein ComEA
MIWTDRQRSALALLIFILLLGLLVRYSQNRAYVSPEQPDVAPRAAEVLDRIDPNTADWPTLAALPVIGPSVARKIVDERETFRANHNDRKPYLRVEDLLRVKGIGQATLKNLEPYLIFSNSDRPTTQP